MNAPLSLGPMAERGPLTALQMVVTPAPVRVLTRGLFLSFFLLPVALLLVPWQQSVTGSGRLVAFDPADRQQVIEAPVDGRVMEWHVCEGSPVRRGDVLVSIRDPDPDFTSRLADERQALEERLGRARERVASLRGQSASLRKSRVDALRAAQSRLEMAERQLESARQAESAAAATLKLARFDFESLTPLESQGLVSRIDSQRAEQRLADAQAKRASAEQSRLAAENLVEAVAAERGKVANDVDAAIQSVQASEQSAEGDVASYERDLAQLKVRQARQATQDVRAPADGTVFRIVANGNGGCSLVKAGDALCVLVPELSGQRGRVVELFVEGNDVPLITELIRHQEQAQWTEPPRIPVRLQFEGWPAVQFVGWPSAAVGTFGGIVRLVDATDDGKGKFRILVAPDAEEEEINPWPTDYSLRQGARANGWVMLNRVSLGWELWRRLNGFPPVVADLPPSGKSDAKKVKVAK